LKEKPVWMPPITRERFVLNATPAINLISMDAEPVMLDHRKTEYRISPSAPNKAHFQIFSIDGVVGHPEGSADTRTYRPFGFFDGERNGSAKGTYQVVMRPGAIERGMEPYLSVAYLPEEVPGQEMLVIRLTCTNGSLPSSLHSGDISRPTDKSPERIDFRNLRPPTPMLQPLSSDSPLARLLSHLSLNYLSIGTAENLRVLLHLYVFPAPEERGAEAANRRRIDGIEQLTIQRANRIVSGTMMRGQNLVLKCRGDHFAGNGDVFLFGSILDRFLSDYAAINSFTRFEIEDVSSGELYLWPERIGQQPLI
jgi:type VI secretion system protein ImpG